MIQTGRKRVPWHWIVLLCVTTGAYGIAEVAIHGAPMQLLLERFTVNPFHLSLIQTLGPTLAIVIAPYVSWKSDRIWTRLGRRRPYMLVGFALLCVAIFVAPLVGKWWMLLGVIIVGNCAVDIGYAGPWSPLFYEVVPTAQRGRGAAIKKGMNHVFGLASNFFLLAQWDNIYNVSLPDSLPGPAKFQLTGGHVMYFVTGTVVLIAWLNLAFNVKENPPDQPIVRETFHPVRFFKEVFAERQWLIIYMLMFCAVALSAGLGGLNQTAMLTKQFGYNKAELGRMIATPTTILNIFVIVPLAFFLADRFDRRMLFRAGLWLSTLHALLVFIYIQVMGPPPIWGWIIMVMAGALVDQVAGIAMEPLVFDLIHPNKMGTAQSGMIIVGRIFSIITIPAVGWVAQRYSIWKYGADSSKYDYSGGYLFVVFLGIAAGFVFWYFEQLYKQGKIIAYGQRETAVDEHLKCAKCGYDLRESKDQCPQCGTPIPPVGPIVESIREGEREAKEGEPATQGVPPS